MAIVNLDTELTRSTRVIGKTVLILFSGRRFPGIVGLLFFVIAAVGLKDQFKAGVEPTLNMAAVHVLLFNLRQSVA